MAAFEDPNKMTSTTAVVTTDQRQQPQLARSLTFSIENILDPMDNINTTFYGHPPLPTPNYNSISHMPKQQQLFNDGHDSLPDIIIFSQLNQQINHMDAQSISFESENSLCSSFNESGAFKLFTYYGLGLRHRHPCFVLGTIAVIRSHCCFLYFTFEYVLLF